MPEPVHERLPAGADADAKRRHYQAVIADLQAILADERNWVAAMATAASVLFHAFGGTMSWVGFYCSWPDDDGDKELVVGPYCGPLACRRIPFGRGVCGAAATTRQTQLVPDVRARRDHIACASSTRSEIVVPVIAGGGGAGGGRLMAVLDVDSDELGAFDAAVDQQQLEQLCAWLGEKYGGGFGGF